MSKRQQRVQTEFAAGKKYRKENEPVSHLDRPTGNRAFMAGWHVANGTYGGIHWIGGIRKRL